MVGEAECFLGAMGDVHDRGGAVVQCAFEIIEKRSASLGVESGRWLVKQEQPRLDRERAREAHSLRLAAGERERLSVAELRDVEALQGRQGGGPPARPVQAPPAQGKFDVADNAGGEQAGALRRVADAALDVHLSGGDRLAVDLDPSGRWCFKAGQEPQQRRLAGSVRAEHRKPLARSQVELVDREHLVAATKVADVAQAYDCAHEAARC